MRRRGALALMAAGFFLYFMAAALVIVDVAGTDAGLYYRLQVDQGVLGNTGVSDDDLLMLDHALADYLRGDENALDVQAEVYGAVGGAFSQREIDHMADVLGLFRLMRGAYAALIPLSAALVAAGVLLVKENSLSRAKAAYGISLAALLVPVGAFGIWALIDFRSAFDAFHHALFENMLWVLNPDTDLMIRMLPEEFFAAFAVRIAAWAGGAIAVPGVGVLLWERLVRRR